MHLFQANFKVVLITEHLEGQNKKSLNSRTAKKKNDIPVQSMHSLNAHDHELLPASQNTCLLPSQQC